MLFPGESHAGGFHDKGDSPPFFILQALDDCKVGQTVKVDLLRVGPSGKPSELSVNVKLADRAEPLILE